MLQVPTKSKPLHQVMMAPSNTKSKPLQVMMAPSNRVIGPLYLHSRMTIISLNMKGNRFYVWEEHSLVFKIDWCYVVNEVFPSRVRNWKKLFITHSLKNNHSKTVRGFKIMLEGSVVESKLIKCFMEMVIQVFVSN